MKHLGTLVAATGLILAPPAQAVMHQFDITGDYTASFQLDSDPSPDAVEDGVGFVLWDVDGFSDAVLGVADVTFYNTAIGGGMGIVDHYGGSILFVTDGPQLYTGPESAPTLLTGIFALTEFGGAGTYTLTVSSLEAAVPEPASWAMMIAGFGLVGGAMRRGQRSTVSLQNA